MNLTSEDIYEIREINNIIYDYKGDGWHNICHDCKTIVPVYKYNSNDWENGYSFDSVYKCIDCRTCIDCGKKTYNKDFEDKECKECAWKKCGDCKTPLPENRPKWKKVCAKCYYENKNKKVNKKKERCSIVSSDDDM